jgi:predicted N-formylglutamate amidohydrolase
MDFAGSILAPEEGDPFAVERADGQGPFVFVCEHASLTLPRAVGNLGLSDEALRSHIAWDPGALAVARLLSERFDSPLVFQRFSRLVYDCNRPPDAPGAMPATSEIYRVPGNENLSQAERDARTNALYRPFHKAISGLIDARRARGLSTSIMTMHSFTPVYFGKPREVEIGILHDNDARLADAMIDAAGASAPYKVRRNEPYGPADGVTHSLQLHGISRGLANVMIEVRNDIIRDNAGQGVVARYLSELIATAIGDAPLMKKTSVNAREN